MDSLCKVENHLLPFLWVQNEKRDRILEEIETIHQSGAEAFYVESCTYETFCQDEWWEDMGMILAEAQKRKMKVWLLDDKHFPTGYANNMVETAYPQHRKWQLTERHADAMGSMKDATFF